MIYSKEIIRDIELYKFSLVIYSHSKRLIAKKSSGVRELTKLIIEQEIDFKNTNELMIGDKVVGKASALLLLKLKPIFIYGSIMSENAKKVFENRGIEIKWSDIVPNILNRDKIDICPLEKLVLNTNSPEEALDIFSKFFY